MTDDITLKDYEPNPLEDLLGNEGQALGIANVYVQYRQKNGANTSMWGQTSWRTFGNLKGDTKINDVLETFENKSGNSKTTMGNQKIGQTCELALALMNLTPYGKNLATGSNIPFEVEYTGAPGTRNLTLTLSTDLITANQFDFSFTTTDISTGVTTSATAVSEVFDTDHDTTMAAIIAAIEANTNINATSTSYTGDVITVVTNANCYLTITSAAVVTLGASQPTTVAVETDTSIISSTIADSEGTIGNLSSGVTSGTGFAAGQMVEVLTGSAAENTEYEYPTIERVDGNILYFVIPLQRLPADAAVIKVVSNIIYYSGSSRLPDNIELRLVEEDHSDESVDLCYFWTASLKEAGGTSRTDEGEEANITFTMIAERVLVNGAYEKLYYKRNTVNSKHGTY